MKSRGAAASSQVVEDRGRSSAAVVVSAGTKRHRNDGATDGVPTEDDSAVPQKAADDPVIGEGV